MPASSAPAFAQNTGVIHGRVVETGSQRGVAEAQVTVTGTTLGAATNPNGDFTISGVPAGTHELSFRRIGYGRRTQQVTVAANDSDNKRISLGLKQATEDPWLSIGENYPVGMELPGKVVRLMDKGVVVDIGNDIEGFVPVSQLNFGNPVNSPADIVYETMNLDLRIMEVDPIHRRIVLAVTNIPEDQPPRPETPSTVIPMETDDYTAVGPPPTDIPYDEGPSD